jgi:hypothetical protein
VLVTKAENHHNNKFKIKKSNISQTKQRFLTNQLQSYDQRAIEARNEEQEVKHQPKENNIHTLT